MAAPPVGSPVAVNDTESDISDTGMNPAPAAQTEIMALANAAMAAAQAAQASAEAMRTASIRSSGGFAEANKVLKYPEPFGLLAAKIMTVMFLHGMIGVTDSKHGSFSLSRSMTPSLSSSRSL